MEQLTVSLPDTETVELSILTSIDDPTNAPVILVLPAMGVRAKFYQPLAKVFAENGINCVLSDLRGLGTSSVRPSSKVDFGYKEMISDLEVVIARVKEKFPEQAIFILGHSLGGQVASLYLSKHPNKVKGLLLVASCSVYYKGWSGGQKWKTFMGIQVFPLLSRLFGYFPGDKVGFGGKGAKTALLDWSYLGRTGQFKIIGDDFDYESSLKKTSIPVFATIIEDDWMAPEAAIKNLYQKFHPNNPTTTYKLTKEIAGKPLNHFNWVKNSVSLVRRIKEWIATIPLR